MKNLPILPLLFLAFTANLFAQESSDWLFNDQSLPEIRIIMTPEYVDSVFDNSFGDTEFPADFIFTRDQVSDTLLNIGFRIRGNTSRSSQKKSFKVSFDTFEKGREYLGLDKMNLNGEHNDPSIIRSKLSWDTFAALDVIAPRSNHVKLYINNDYYGLYMNVEHIDNEFIDDRFKGNTGNLYKSLYPADLTYLGANPDDYKREEHGRRIYELKTNELEDDYTDIANLIKFLEQASDQQFENEIRDYINVDGVLKVMAVDMMTGMWDDYMFNKNNFYLYFNTPDNRFEMIPFDYDNTFGIDWFGIDWDTRDINNWGSNDDRPLTDRIFAIPKFKTRLHYYINLLIDSHFNSSNLFPEIDRLKAMIQQAAEDDTYRTLDYGYSIEDFNTSYDNGLGAHVKKGIKEYITNRYNSAKSQLQLSNIHPIFLDTDFAVQNTAEGPALVIESEIYDDDSPSLTAKLSGALSGDFTMNDDGTNGDEIADDGTFTATIVLGNATGILSFYVEASDQQNQNERYPFNPDQTISAELVTVADNLVINEFMASNATTIQDETGAFADWVELYNPTDAEISLLGYFLTDNLSNPTKWAFPDTTIAADGFLLIWVDDDVEDGPLHASFKLSKSGEDLGIFFDNGTEIETIDAFSYNAQQTDISFGRETDGSTAFISFANPTPGASNGKATTSELFDDESPEHILLHQNYPNPFNPSTTISFTLAQPSSARLSVYSVTGSLVQTLADGKFSAGSHQFKFEASSLASGVYFYRLETESGLLFTQKMSLLK